MGKGCHSTTRGTSRIGKVATRNVCDVGSEKLMRGLAAGTGTDHYAAGHLTVPSVQHTAKPSESRTVVADVKLE